MREREREVFFDSIRLGVRDEREGVSDLCNTVVGEKCKDDAMAEREK